MESDDRSVTAQTTESTDHGFGWKKTAFVCFVIILVGAGITGLIFYTQPGTSRGGRPEGGAILVETTPVDTGTFRPRIEAMGTVKPAQDVVLQPRVSGEVIKRFDNFTSGGYVLEGDTLIQIDPSDFRNTVEQRRSELRQALSKLRIEKGQQEVAREEYNLIDKKISEDNRDLVLRKPQLNSARASVKSARAALNQAKLDLKRTTIKAPFDAHILSRNVSKGSQVSRSDNLGRLVGLDKFWVEATVAVSKLPWLNIPDTPGTKGPPVRIENRSSWTSEEYRTGRLSKLVGQLDEEARMAKVRIAVHDPMAYDIDDMHSPPLVIGSYVRTIMKGRPIRHIARIDRDYVREDDTVWLMVDGKLKIESVRVVFKDQNYAYVREGLSGGDRIVTTDLSTVVEGSKLKTKSQDRNANNDAASDTKSARTPTPFGNRGS